MLKNRDFWFLQLLQIVKSSIDLLQYIFANSKGMKHRVLKGSKNCATVQQECNQCNCQSLRVHNWAKPFLTPRTECSGGPSTVRLDLILCLRSVLDV